MLVAYVIVGFAVTVTVNELLIQSLTLKNFYTCRLARLISPVGSSWIYCKRFLPDFFASWFWKSITASHILANTVSWSCEPSVSWFAVYRMCVMKKSDPFFQSFSTGFDVLTTNKSPLEPVGGFLLSRIYFTRCRYFLGHVACRNLPWQGLYNGYQ